MKAPWRGAGGKFPEQLARLDEFRGEHPGVLISEGEFRDGWDASIPLEDDGERVLHRNGLERLLDDAESILAGGDPRARPGLALRLRGGDAGAFSLPAPPGEVRRRAGGHAGN